MKKLRNIIFHSMYSKINQKYFVFFRHKGQPILLQLLRCEALAVDNHGGVPHALHLQQPRLVRKAGYGKPKPLLYFNRYRPSTIPADFSKGV